jgi:broad specificity phosphatase PhoE
MSELYLIRHGQAGSRADYDRLSETGRVQARLLGAYFRAQGTRFTAAFCGGMRRQRETAQTVLAELPDAPPLEVDERWNEFSLEGLWEHLAPRLMEEDAGFARQYASEHAGNPEVERTITSCDITLIRAWVRGASHPEVESWRDFRARVEAARDGLTTLPAGSTIAVFTSATPTGIWCGNAFGLPPRDMLRIAAVLYNSSFSTLRLRPHDLTLQSLNQTPHLDPALRTYR